MAQITATLVKELRDKTGAGMMDAKKALVETDGDIEVAVDWLRKKGLSKAAKKADRAAADGLVAVAAEADGKGMRSVAVEVNAETDFVARNELFQNAVKQIAGLGLTKTDLASLGAAKMASGETVSEALTTLIATIGEHMSLRRVQALSVNPGVVATYVHNAAGDDMGRLGVLVALKSEGDQAKLAELGRRIAMHVAAGAPSVALAVDVDELDPTVVARERAVFTEQARASGKPDAIIEKMVDGRIRKFYEEVVLLKQAFVLDPEKTIEETLKAAAAEVGAPVTLTGFVRMVLGEGVEKKADDFAAEVAAMSKS